MSANSCGTGFALVPNIMIMSCNIEYYHCTV